VGSNGAILHYDGSAWSSMNSRTRRELSGVWGASGSDVYAVGEYGTILHYGPPSPRLSIHKKATHADLVPYRGSITYTLVLKNSGAGVAVGTWLTDTLPVEVDFSRWLERPGGASVVDDEITWNGTVTAGEAITLSFVVDHVGGYGDVVTNTAVYHHSSGDGSDSATFTVEESALLFLPLVTTGLVP
jgi:hypothetical protein